MPFCENCGNQVLDTAKFCSNCGSKINVTKDQDLIVTNESNSELSSHLSNNTISKLDDNNEGQSPDMNNGKISSEINFKPIDYVRPTKHISIVLSQHFDSLAYKYKIYFSGGIPAERLKAFIKEFKKRYNGSMEIEDFLTLLFYDEVNQTIWGKSNSNGGFLIASKNQDIYLIINLYRSSIIKLSEIESISIAKTILIVDKINNNGRKEQLGFLLNNILDKREDLGNALIDFHKDCKAQKFIIGEKRIDRQEESPLECKDTESEDTNKNESPIPPDKSRDSADIR